jgi:hypothetical protein
MPLTSGLSCCGDPCDSGLGADAGGHRHGDYYLAEAQSDEIRALGAELRYKPLWLDELVTLARESADRACA